MVEAIVVSRIVYCTVIILSICIGILIGKHYAKYKVAFICAGVFALGLIIGGM